VAQTGSAVAVLVAGGDHQHAEAQDVRHAVAHALGIARVDQAASETVGQTDPPLNLAQQQQAAVRGHLAAVKTADHPLTGDR
jgi:hypothetical protein